MSSLEKTWKWPQKTNLKQKKNYFWKILNFWDFRLFFVKTFHIPSFSGNGGPKYGWTSPHTPKYLISMQKTEEMSKKKLRNCPSSDARWDSPWQSVETITLCFQQTSWLLANCCSSAGKSIHCFWLNFFTLKIKWQKREQMQRNRLSVRFFDKQMSKGANGLNELCCIY